jgi:beta-lactamase family protein/carboxypeptidase family protein/PEGA domain-containing protein
VGRGIRRRLQSGRAVLALAVVALPVALGASAFLPQSVSGRVTDASGRPVADATVTPTDPLHLGSQQASTDSAGRYRVGARGWPLNLNVSITAPGFSPTRTAGGMLVLHRWATVGGRAVDDTGAPVAGASVTLTRGRQFWIGRTDQDGRFSLAATGASGGAWLAVQSERHEPAYAAPSLAADRVNSYSMVLPRLQGAVQLTTDPPGQTPTIDGQPASECKATPCELQLSVGPHHIEFQSDLYVPWAEDIQIDRGDSLPVTVKLERKTGTLKLTAPVAGELTIDGEPVGGAGAGWTGPVPTGKHSVVFRSSATWPFRADVDVAWKQTTENGLTPTGVVPGDAAAFNQALQAYLGRAGGSYGIYVEDLKSGATLGAGQDSVLEAASVIKVPEALFLLRQVDAGKIKLTDQIELKDGDFMSGTGTLYSTAHAGDKFAVQDLLALLIRQSDNTAWRALDRTLGIPAVDAYAASIGAPDCHQVSDNCTARQAGIMMSQLARGRLLSSSSTQLLMNLLETTVFNDRINYYVRGVTVAHKVGMDGGVINDCGVVFLPGAPMSICVFTTTGDPSLGVQVIRDVTRAAVHYYGH